jgi:quinol monooxygenase YgiN
MFGTIAVATPRSGQEAAVIAHFNDWWKNRAPSVPGPLLGTVYRETANPGELMVTVVFSSKAAYDANAADPAQDAWYQKLVSLLEKEPRWIDGDVVACHSRGAI